MPDAQLSNGNTSHYFTALCQQPNCRAPRGSGGAGKVVLGQFHVPAPGGVVRYVCYNCRCVSEFQVTVLEGIRGTWHAPPPRRS